MGSRFPAVLALCALLAGTGAAAADARRGRILYEAHCGSCHAESVHGRESRAAANYEAVRGWVRRWAANLSLRWTDEEVADVASHLNERYYRFACPPSDCRRTGGVGDGRRRLALDGRSPQQVP
ncbi:MAG: cytochrome C [Burkholderiales bacterium]